MTKPKEIVLHLPWEGAQALRAALKYALGQSVTATEFPFNRGAAEALARVLVDSQCSHSYVMPHLFCPQCRKPATMRRAIRKVNALYTVLELLQQAFMDTLKETP